MERKIIQLANKTLVVSIPKEWAQKYRYRKGETVTVVDKGGQIVIAKARGRDVLAVDVTTLPQRFVKRAIAAAYKTGATAFNIRAGRHHDLVLREVEGLVGLVAFEEDGLIRVKNAAAADDTDFTNQLAKVFLQLGMAAQELDDDHRSHEHLERCQRTVSYCIVLLSSRSTRSIQETNNQFYILSLLRTIASIYERILKEDSRARLAEEAMLKRLERMIAEVHAYVVGNGSLESIYKTREDVLSLKRKGRMTATRAYAILVAKLLRDIVEARYTIDLMGA